MIIITARTEFRRGASLFYRQISGNKGEELLGGFGLLATVVVIVSGMALNAASDANDEFSRYVNGVNARASLSAQVRTAVDRRAIAEMNDHCRPLLAELVSATNAYASFTHARERVIAQAFADRYAFDPTCSRRSACSRSSPRSGCRPANGRSRAPVRMRPACAARVHAACPSHHVGRTRVARRIVLHATYT
ncbi:hypothetical protein WM21_13660 [Burkholderia ubonensis]|nr:hypothetical protein WM21_13660 [Burkholderia ubonensis]